MTGLKNVWNGTNSAICYNKVAICQNDSIMTFNCELCQSEFSVLSTRFIMKLSKICFLYAYVDKMIIQQRLMFCSKFSFTIFLLMFSRLCSNVFTNIQRFMNYLKEIIQYLNITKHLSEQNNLPGQFYVTTSSSFWYIALLTLLKCALEGKGIFWH